MKYYIAILIIFFSLSGKGQGKDRPFLINGQFRNLSHTTVFLEYSFAGKTKVDSVKADANGQFSFKGNVPEPLLANLTFKHHFSVYQFFLENTIYTLNGDLSGIVKTQIKAGPEQEVYSKYSILLSELNRFSKDMQMPIHYNLKRKDTSGLNSFVYASTLLWRDSLIKRQVDFVSANPSSAVSLYVMKRLTGSDTPASTLDSLMRLIEKTSAAHYPSAPEIRKIINSRFNIVLGSKAPDFSQPDTSGKQVSLSHLRGRYVLLDFWASWCAPCRKENPNVLKVYNQYKNANFTVLAVSIDVNRGQWIKAVLQDNLPWNQLSDLKAKNEASKLYGVTGLPMNFLIDPKGKIIGMNLRGSELEKAVENAVSSQLR